jgi:hypothetical protein
MLSASSSFPPDDPRNSGLVDAVLLGDVCLGQSAITRELDGVDGSGIYRSDERHNASVGCMQIVADPGRPFEVCDKVVGFVEVNVVDLRQFTGVFDERPSDEPVDGGEFSTAITVFETHGHVTATSKSQFEHSCSDRRSASVAILAETREAANAAMAAHFIKWRELSNRYRPPFFCAGDVHVTGFPPWDKPVAYSLNQSATQEMGG